MDDEGGNKNGDLRNKNLIADGKHKGHESINALALAVDYLHTL